MKKQILFRITLIICILISGVVADVNPEIKKFKTRTTVEGFTDATWVVSESDAKECQKVPNSCCFSAGTLKQRINQHQDKVITFSGPAIGSTCYNHQLGVGIGGDKTNSDFNPDGKNPSGILCFYTDISNTNELEDFSDNEKAILKVDDGSEADEQYYAILFPTQKETYEISTAKNRLTLKLSTTTQNTSSNVITFFFSAIFIFAISL